MDRASKALAQGFPSSVPRSYRALTDHSNVPRSTLHDRARGQRSIEAKAQSQQYLTPYEEKAMIDFILQMSALGTPVRIKYISSIAFTAARGRPEHDRPQKPPGKNWAKALEKRHPELKAKRVKALDWDRHEKNIYPKIEDWFELIGKVLDGPDILSENVYNMDETGVMLSKRECSRGRKVPEKVNMSGETAASGKTLASQRTGKTLLSTLEHNTSASRHVRTRTVRAS